MVASEMKARQVDGMVLETITDCQSDIVPFIVEDTASGKTVSMSMVDTWCVSTCQHDTPFTADPAEPIWFDQQACRKPTQILLKNGSYR
jgi:hypothetical protein